MAKRQKSKQQEPSFLEEDDMQTQTQTTLTQAEKAVASIAGDELERKINEVVRYMLITDHKKAPIKRADINKHVLKEKSRAFAVIIKKAEARLKDLFGIELRELPNKHQKSYILVNLIETDVDEQHLKWPEKDNARIGLTVVVLSLIFMSNNMMEESKLFHVLKRLGVDTDEHHEVFGDVRRMLTQELVRQGYVEYIRQQMTDPPAYDFRWGPRAYAETCKRNILDFVCQVYEDVDPSVWTSQWADVQRSEGKAA